MTPMLEEIEAFPGVLGFVVCDRDGAVRSSRFSRGSEADAAAVARALADATHEFQVLAGRVSLVDLHYAHRRILARPVGADTLLVLLDKGAAPRTVAADLARVVDAHERRAPQAAPAPPAVPPLPAGAAPAPRAAPSSSPRPAAGARALASLRARWPVYAGAAAAVVVAGLVAWLGGRKHASAPAPAAGPAAAAARPAAAPVPAGRVILRLGGAKAMAEECAPALAAAYLAAQGATDVQVVKAKPYEFAARGTKDGEVVAITVAGMHTPKAFDDLAAGTLDVAMTGRRIKPEWQQKAAALGSLTAPGAEHVVGLSGIAVVVNMANPVARLDARQLAGIFSGTVKDWAAVRGGAPGRAGPIRVYATSDTMGLTDLFKGLVLGSAAYAPEAKRVATLQEMNDAVAADPDGIGFLTLPFVRGTRAVPLAESDEPPLVPTAFTVATEDYLLTHRLYLYAPPGGQNPEVLRFVQFALGPEGQAVVRKSGYVELSVVAERRDATRQAPAEYLRITDGARRLTSTFRFESGSSDFDARSLVDLERVTRYVVDNRLEGAAVRILGFADAQGSPAQNRKLSLARAELVARAFETRGVRGMQVRGFGSELPIASNATPEGRERNRRVEVWVTH